MRIDDRTRNEIQTLNKLGFNTTRLPSDAANIDTLKKEMYFKKAPVPESIADRILKMPNEVDTLRECDRALKEQSILREIEAQTDRHFVDVKKIDPHVLMKAVNYQMNMTDE